MYIAALIYGYCKLMKEFSQMLSAWFFKKK
jgi:hypothetical protein